MRARRLGEHELRSRRRLSRQASSRLALARRSRRRVPRACASRSQPHGRALRLLPRRALRRADMGRSANRRRVARRRGHRRLARHSGARRMAALQSTTSAKSSSGILPAMAAKKAEPVMIDVSGQEVRVSNPEKPFFPARGLTKLDLVNYYVECAEAVVRGLHDRPTVMKRWVDGVDGEPFFQKRVPD